MEQVHESPEFEVVALDENNAVFTATSAE